jgi:hypothetical protein
MYHVMNRGDQREAIFKDDPDRQKFLSTLGEACEKTEWQVHAYCLMSNPGRLMEKRRAEEGAADYQELRRAWVLGSEDFRRELLAAAAERVGMSHYGAERHETGVQKAERIVREELQRLDWQEEGLGMQPKGHRAKVRMARRLRQETTMSLKWIAKRLEMGSWTYVSNLLNGNPGSGDGQPVLPLFQ